MMMTMQRVDRLDFADIVETNCVGTVVDADVAVCLDCLADSSVHGCCSTSLMRLELLDCLLQ